MTIKATLRSRKRKRRILWASVLVVLVAIIVVAYLIAASLNNPYRSFIGVPVSSTIYRGLAGFSTTTLSAVGAGSAKAPATITGSSLTSGGKAEVLYVGGEYCPYCGVTRWSMIIAFSKFGNFTGLEYMLSSATDTNPNTPTFTFANSSYTSPYITFVAVEHWDRSDSAYQPLTSSEQALFSEYDTSGGIPFIDFANQYLVTGVNGGLATLDLAGMNWTQVMSQLNNPSSPTAQAIVGEANFLVTTICAIDGHQPSSVCSESYATQTLAYAGAGPAVSQTALLAVPPSRSD